MGPLGPASAPHPRSAVLASLDLFAALSPAERDALAAAAHPQTYAPGEDLFQEGETCRGIHIVASGAVKIVKTTPAGRQVMLAHQEVPATVAEVPAFDGGLYPATVTAAQPVSAFLIHKEDSLVLVQRQPTSTECGQCPQG